MSYELISKRAVQAFVVVAAVGLSACSASNPPEVSEGHISIDDDAKAAIDELKGDVKFDEMFIREDIAEVSVVGVGMRSHYGVANKMFDALAEAKVNIDSITTSEIRISCAVDECEAEKALEAVCVVFELDKSAVQRSK